MLLAAIMLPSAMVATGSEVATSVKPSRQKKSSQLLLAGLKNGCASGLATVCAKTLLQPFDTVQREAAYRPGRILVADETRPICSTGEDTAAGELG